MKYYYVGNSCLLVYRKVDSNVEFVFGLASKGEDWPLCAVRSSAVSMGLMSAMGAFHTDMSDEELAGRMSEAALAIETLYSKNSRYPWIRQGMSLCEINQRLEQGKDASEAVR